MANQITDNRTVVASADSVTGDNGGRWDTLNSTSETLDTDVKIEGTGSIGEQFTNSVRTLIWDAGSNQNYANNTFYIWVNCGIVGLLDTKANGGFAVRFTGPSSSNFFEFYVGGSDSWPAAVQGGWVQFVVDIEATPSNTGGTPPATTAIRGVGISGVTASKMTKVSDNTWIDEIRRLPTGNPGIIVEGRNGGTTDWDSSDIVTQLGVSAGTFRDGPAGTYLINTPIQFGINDTSTHGFTDTNATWLWDDQEWLETDFYSITGLGNSGGTTDVTFGIKSGTGDNASGSQGLTIQAAAAGDRWSMDFTDANLDTIGLYGSTFTHGDVFDLDVSSTDIAGVVFLDCSTANVSNANVVRATVVDANTADGVAFMFTDDCGDLAYCDFTFSDGHAIEILTGGPAGQDLTGLTFSGYGADTTNDAAIYNNAAALRTLTVGGGGDTSPTVRDGTSASTVIVAGAVTTLVNVIDSDGDDLEDVRVLLYASAGPLPSQDVVTISNSGTLATVTHTAHGLVTGDKVMILGGTEFLNRGVQTVTVNSANEYEYNMAGTPGGSPTGTITSTFVILSGLTDVSGNISASRTFGTDQPVVGVARKSSSEPYYVTGNISGTISTTTGLSSTVQMILDQ